MIQTLKRELNNNIGSNSC